MYIYIPCNVCTYILCTIHIFLFKANIIDAKLTENAHKKQLSRKRRRSVSTCSTSSQSASDLEPERPERKMLKGRLKKLVKTLKKQKGNFGSAIVLQKSSCKGVLYYMDIVYVYVNEFSEFVFK